MIYPQDWKDIKNGRQSKEEYSKLHYPEWYDYLCNRYKNISFSEAAYLFYHNLEERPVCPECGSFTTFRGFTKGYSRFCGSSCAGKNKETLEKHIISLKKHFGDNYSEVIVEKGARTKIERYGSVSYNNKEKYKQTCLERYGVDNPTKLETIKSKTRKTCLKKYGVEYVTQSSEYKSKMREKYNRDVSERYGDVISLENGIFTCRCAEEDCQLCNEKIYRAPYYVYYERRFKYNHNPCTIKYPIGSINANNQSTSIELFIRDILDKYNIKYITNDRKILKGKELDIYIPSRKLAIECNGCYWHSQYPKEYHYNKFISCKEKDIQLLTVWEDQILNNPEKIESIILSKLGIYERRLYARECSIHLVDSVHCREFLDCYHLQGSVNSSVRLGLYHNDELISVMTFGKGRKCLNSKDEWELYRYCCKSGVQVIGGASKLFKYFINNYYPNSIISFSSNDISDGSLYRVLGFEEQSNSIGYWYILGSKRFHRYRFRKQDLVKQGYDPNKTESEIMKERGYLKIYDSGQIKWKYIENRRI